MNMIQRGVGLVVLGSVMALSAASSASSSSSSGSGSSGSGGSGSSSTSSISLRSMMGHKPADAASDASCFDPRPAECKVPEKGILYYIEEGTESLIPWVCNNKEMLAMAIRRSGRGAVPGQAPNVFYVNREWACRLKGDAEGHPVQLYYVVEGTSPLDLFTCDKQSLVAEAIIDSGCKRFPNQAANAFCVTREWAGILKAAGSVLTTDFKCVADGDGITDTFDSILNLHVIKKGINAFGCRHVTGNPAANVYWISKEDGALLRLELKNFLAQVQKKDERSVMGGIALGALLAGVVGFGLYAESRMTPEEYARNQQEKKEWGM